MSEKNDGGPAFPFAATDPSNVHMQDSGMTLRDWFAGQALAGLAMHFEPEVRVAVVAYEVADAMLAARSKGDDA